MKFVIIILCVSGAILFVLGDFSAGAQLLIVAALLEINESLQKEKKDA